MSEISVDLLDVVEPAFDELLCGHDDSVEFLHE
jgi:hypothetical protein